MGIEDRDDGIVGGLQLWERVLPAGLLEGECW